MDTSSIMGTRYATNRKKDLIVASRALRVSVMFTRVCSRCSQKLATVFEYSFSNVSSDEGERKVTGVRLAIQNVLAYNNTNPTKEPNTKYPACKVDDAYHQ